MKIFSFLILLFLVSCGGSGGGAVQSDSTNPPVNNPDTPKNLEDIDVSCENPADQEGESGFPFHAKGRAEDTDFFLICNANQFSKMAETQYMEDNFALGSDIDMSSFYDDPMNPSNQFIIGDENNPFMGIFFGDGYKISNFIYKNQDGNFCGMFGRIDTSQILSLILENVTMESQVAGFCGGLVGRASGSIISNVGIKGGRVLGTTVGGITGQLDNVILEDSYSSIDIEALSSPSFLGGLAAFSEGPSRVSNYFFAGTIVKNDPSDVAGGILAITPSEDIENPQNNLEITNTYFDEASSVSLGCSSSFDCGGQEINSVNTNDNGFEDYFYLSQNEPINSWDVFAWIFSGTDFPVLD